MNGEKIQREMALCNGYEIDNGDDDEQATIQMLKIDDRRELY